MPIYEYLCRHCQHQFDLLQKMAEEPVKTCPECHTESAERLVSAAGFQLKGTGWYATDFKHKGTAKEAEAKQKAATAAKTKTGDSD